jgi:predicted nuclease of predicted toxin-antitoxin system
MRFLIDECLPQRLKPIVVAADHNAIHVITEGRRGLRDSAIWSWAASEQRVLITADKGFPRQERPAPPGVVLLRLPSSYNGEQILAVFQEFVDGGGLDRASGQIVVIEPDRIRLRPLGPN